MFENTANEMNQVLNKMSQSDSIDDLDMNEYEQRAFRDLYEQCQEYIVRYRELAAEFIEE
jgi:hypothetical protein